MKNHQFVFLSFTFLAVLSACQNQTAEMSSLPSQVFSLDSTATLEENFGTVTLYVAGEESTYGTKDVTTGIITVKPNDEVHPPHTHVEEEYLLITKGSGIWHLNSKEFPAKRGDLLYAAPWDVHGIFNSDTTEMEFYFVKWNNKGVELPKEK